MDTYTQVRLRLTEDRDVLNAARRNKIVRNPGDPKKEHIVLQFDSRFFEFYHGKDVVVPEPVANGLYASSGVLVGDPINGGMKGLIEKVESWPLGAVASKTACPVCGKNQGHLEALVEHLKTHTIVDTIEDDKEEIEEAA